MSIATDVKNLAVESNKKRIADNYAKVMSTIQQSVYNKALQGGTSVTVKTTISHNMNNMTKELIDDYGFTVSATNNNGTYTYTISWKNA